MSASLAMRTNNEALYFLQREHRYFRETGFAGLKRAASLMESDIRCTMIQSSANTESEADVMTRTMKKARSSCCTTSARKFRVYAVPVASSDTTNTVLNDEETKFRSYFAFEQDEEDCSASCVSSSNNKEGFESACLAVCLYNMALTQHIKCQENRTLPEHELRLYVATVYETAYNLLMHSRSCCTQHQNRDKRRGIKMDDSLSLVILAILNNLCALYQELGDLNEYSKWHHQLCQGRNLATLWYHRSTSPNGDIFRSIQITSSIYGFFAAQAA